jgi:hypothetical protein
VLRWHYSSSNSNEGVEIMGDRANAYVELPTGYGADAGRGGIYLYTHWSGYDWPEKIREALEFGEGRWNDDQYLTRILTSRVFRDLTESTVGGGIGLTMGDNERPVIVVDTIRQEVSFAAPGEEKIRAKRYATKSFREFVDQNRADWIKPLS